MSKLDSILSFAKPNCWQSDVDKAKLEIKYLIIELLGEAEYRETVDMSLKSWTLEDHKAFARNEYRTKLLKEIGKL